jgi:hypothetical protein
VSRNARRSAGVTLTGETAELESAPTQARRAIEEAEVVHAARTRPFAISLAVLSTALCAGFVLTSSAPTSVTVAQPAPVTATIDSNVDTLSRGAVDREAAVATEATTTPSAAATTAAPAPQVLYVTSVAYLRQQANPSAKVLATLAVGTQVTATGDAVDGWQPVASGSTTGFVKATLLATAKPAATTTKKTASGTSAAGAASAYPACASGSGVESGLAANTILVHRAVCTTYPSITAFGGLSGSGSEHASGHALDIMVSGSAGLDVAAWLRANYATFGITEIIYQQQIWTTQRSSEGWRAMSDRGSVTANHYDHIHVLVS